MEQILDAYNFINKVFKENYDKIKGKCAILEKDIKQIKHKEKTIKIKIFNIKNYPNEEFIKLMKIKKMNKLILKLHVNI